MRHRTSFTVALSALIMLAAGCRQGTAVPNPLSAFTPNHVPPPATGSYQIPDRYYKGQANTSGGQAAAGMASNEAVIGSGVAQSSFVDRNGNDNKIQPAGHVQSSGDLSNYRGFAADSRASAAPQPINIANFSDVQDIPPAPQAAPRPSTAPLSWQTPGQ